jgi:hypothetical protein
MIPLRGNYILEKVRLLAVALGYAAVEDCAFVCDRRVLRVAPFAFGTYKTDPFTSGFVPLTAAQRADVAAYLARFNDCRELEMIPMDKLPREADECFRQKGLMQQGEHYSYFSTPKYLAMNAGAALAGFVAVFGLAMLLPVLARRYWRWLKA